MLLIRCLFLRADQGKRILILDDVITAGTAIRESMGILKEAEGTPAGVVVALDRQVKPRPLPTPASWEASLAFKNAVVYRRGMAAKAEEA